MSYSVILVRILPVEYLEDFLSGNLFLNTSAYFGKMDATDPVRYDPFDGIDGIDESMQVREVAIQDQNGNWIPIGGVINPVTTRSQSSELSNILCMYTLTNRPEDNFDNRNLSFGDQAVFIANHPEYLRRLKAAAEAARKTVAHKPVEYVDRSSYDGPMGPFRKFSEQGFQREFRLHFSNGDGNPCWLSVGDIRDIAVVIPSNEIQAQWDHMRSGANP